MVRTAYVGIGNSDDKLSQQTWAEFQHDVFLIIKNNCQGGASGILSWYSLPNAPHQSACYCFDVIPSRAEEMKIRLRATAKMYRQDAIAWSIATVESLS